MKVLVVYDISSNEVRAKLAEDLKRLGLTRIQRSAFIGNVSSTNVKELARMCSMRVKGPNDVVHIIQLCDYDWRRVVVIGKPMNEYGGDVVLA